MMMDYFMALSRQRPHGMSEIPQAIPFSEIVHMWNIYHIDEFMEVAEFCDWIIELDNELIAFYSRTKKKTPKPP